MPFLVPIALARERFETYPAGEIDSTIPAYLASGGCPYSVILFGDEVRALFAVEIVELIVAFGTFKVLVIGSGELVAEDDEAGGAFGAGGVALRGSIDYGGTEGVNAADLVVRVHKNIEQVGSIMDNSG